jgi:hypothetical protein
MLWIKLYGDRQKPAGWTWESVPITKT